MKPKRKIEIGQRLYINGSIQTEELVVSKIGTKYASFSNSPHRYLCEYDAVQVKTGTQYQPGGTKVFDSAEDAEKYLFEVMK